MTDNWRGSEITVERAITIIIAASAVGGAFGYLFTVHLVGSVVEAVWLTSVLFTVGGLSLWSIVQS